MAAEMAERHAVETTVPEWRERLACFSAAQGSTWW
jgi:hypothetical protein